jgi:hypothetical protein
MKSNLNYLVWLHILNQKLTPPQWNRFIQKVNETGLEEEVFKTSITDYDQFFNDFLDGKYEIIRKEN